MPYRPVPHIASDKTLAAIHNRLDALEDQVALLERELAESRQSSEPAPSRALSGELMLPPDRALADSLAGDDRRSEHDATASTESSTGNDRKAPFLAGAGLIAATLLVIEMAT